MLYSYFIDYCQHWGVLLITCTVTQRWGVLKRFIVIIHCYYKDYATLERT
jgi:hypothetical protein